MTWGAKSKTNGNTNVVVHIRTGEPITDETKYEHRHE